MYALAESCLVIITSSGPALRPLFARWCFGGLAETTERYNVEGAYKRYHNARSTDASTGKGAGASRVSARRRTQDLSLWEPEAGDFPLQDIREGQARAEVGVSVGVGMGGPRRASGSEDGSLPRNGIVMTREYTVNSSTTQLTDKETKE